MTYQMNQYRFSKLSEQTLKPNIYVLELIVQGKTKRSFVFRNIITDNEGRIKITHETDSLYKLRLTIIKANSNDEPIVVTYKINNNENNWKDQQIETKLVKTNQNETMICYKLI